MPAITTPTLLVDKQKVCANIERMAEKADSNGLTLKPHFKTHQSVAVGKWFKERGIKKITVSSVTMAEYFAGDGWSDITIAFPCNILLIDRIDTLAGKINLSVLVGDPQTVEQLDDKLTNTLQVYVEIDTGSQRTGLKSDDFEAIENLIQQINTSSKLVFNGFYSHPGHSYDARSKDEIQKIHQDVLEQIKRLNANFKADFPNLLCCVGDTPCCSVGNNWNGVDEISPGNFVLYDLMQAQIGSCKNNDIAVALACPVVAVYPDRQQIVTHGGAVHLSRDSLAEESVSHFGKIVLLQDDLTWNEHVEDCYVKSLSQEHGIIQCSKSFIQNISIGDVIGILPVHSCLTADTMKGYITCESTEKLDHMQASISKTDT